jgi:hypothetical protein
VTDRRTLDHLPEPKPNRAARRRAKRAEMLERRHDLERQYRSRNPRPPGPNREQRRRARRYLHVVDDNVRVPTGRLRDALAQVTRSGVVEVLKQVLDGTPWGGLAT